MTGYLIVFLVSLLLGYYMGNKAFRRRVHNMIASFRSRYDDDDYYEDEDDD